MDSHEKSRSIMSSLGRCTATLCILVSLVVANIPEAFTGDDGKDIAPTLEITSNIGPRRLYLRDTVGPFVIGKSLTLTCSTDYSEPVFLTWWEGGEQLATVASFGDGIVSRRFIVGTLQAKDSQRHFTCRELVSGTEKSFDLDLVDDHMDIQKDGRSLIDEAITNVFLGKIFNLSCVVNGSNPRTGIWWEGKTKLPAKRTRSHDAVCNQLAVLPASFDDNGRKLTCRALNGQLTKTVVLNVVEDVRSFVQFPSIQATQATVSHPTSRTTLVNTTNIPPVPIAIRESQEAIEIYIYLIAFGVPIVVLLVGKFIARGCLKKKVDSLCTTTKG